MASCLISVFEGKQGGINKAGLANCEGGIDELWKEPIRFQTLWWKNNTLMRAAVMRSQAYLHLGTCHCEPTARALTLTRYKDMYACLCVCLCEFLEFRFQYKTTTRYLIISSVLLPVAQHFV